MVRKTTSKKPSAAVAAPIPVAKQSFFANPVVVLVVVAAMIVGALYLWVFPPKSPSPVQPSQDEMQKQADSIVDKVARLMVVDRNTQPYIATITDIDAVRQANPFYKDAEQGDKVLIWLNDKAVIYSERYDKIIAVVAASPAPATTTSASSTTEVMATTTLESVKIEVRNGSGVAGKAASVRDALKAVGLTVSRIGDAKTRPEATIVIDLTAGKAPNALAKVQAVAGGTVGTLPEGEVASTADILVIIGKQ